MEEARPVESGHKLRDTIRRILHTRPSFSFHLGEKGLWRESKSGQHGVEHDFCLGNESIDFETQPERQHAAAAGVFMLDDSPGKVSRNLSCFSAILNPCSDEASHHAGEENIGSYPRIF